MTYCLFQVVLHIPGQCHVWPANKSTSYTPGLALSTAHKSFRSIAMIIPQTQPQWNFHLQSTQIL